MTVRTTADAGRGRPDRRPPRAGTGRAVLAVVLAALVLLGADAALLAARVDRVAVDLNPGPGTTWVLLGLDDRAALPAGAPMAEFGTAEQVPGSRADVVLVVHEDGDRTSLLSVPRDLLVRGPRVPERLALTWLRGPQGTVDALCDLGIPTDHLVTVDLAGFAAVVDAVGGIDLDVPVPVRDPAAGLLVTEGGPQHVDGRTALALVRSRHPEHRVDGRWVPVPPDPDGRASAAATVLTALAAAARTGALQPGRLQATAWAASSALTVDTATSLADFAALAGTDPSRVDVLPGEARDGPVPVRLPTAETADALTAAGLSCQR
ncbi:transcriptional regulator [Geodermatophilus sp. TF02-6]|uniref:LCP family protein n=1 Tax=Geodermatophilus sp. TF02-6 TaxID=2250575 RepID=UPI000DE92C80|nr:LCP family protein [Geodermatophilus sp. TF02-6]RBY82118.1 transcriptional regulator [Geodermatophilus sp. TF02-6]